MMILALMHGVCTVCVDSQLWSCSMTVGEGILDGSQPFPLINLPVIFYLIKMVSILTCFQKETKKNKQKRLHFHVVSQDAAVNKDMAITFHLQQAMASQA